MVVVLTHVVAALVVGFISWVSGGQKEEWGMLSD